MNKPPVYTVNYEGGSRVAATLQVIAAHTGGSYCEADRLLYTVVNEPVRVGAWSVGGVTASVVLGE